MKHLLWPIAAILSTCAAPAAAQTVSITPAASWKDCAKEDATCAAPANALVRYGAATKYVYRVVAGSVGCNNREFGDPIVNTVKACAYAVPAGVVTTPPVVPPPVVVVPSPTPTPTPVPTKPVLSARDKLGINVTQGFYWSREAVYANQARSIQWISPRDNWSAIPNDRLTPAGYPKSVAGVEGRANSGVLAFLNPPTEAYNGGDTLTRCTYKGTGNIWLHGSYSAKSHGPGFIEFTWTGKPDVVGFDIRTSSASDPIRDIECRRVGSDPNALFDPQMFEFHKPFGVVRFLDWTAANANPAKVTWATRTQPGSVAFTGTDGNPLEDRIAFAVQNKSSPWETIPFNADDDYIRRLAQMYHDRIPAGTTVYVELSNEVWNYSFGVTYQAQKEGLERKLTDNAFQAVLYRYAQRVTEVMPIIAEVFKDRPKDLVRVAASQAGNPWTGGEVMRWNNNAVTKHIDAFAIAPYFYEEAGRLTDDLPSNMAKLAVRAKETSKVIAEYKKLTDQFGIRLIAYEGGQHQLDPGNIARLNAMNRDPAIRAIYKTYLDDWSKATGDLMTLYSATGGASQYGFWGIREYSGQPLSQTPKRQGVLDFATP